jgi:hypothetical protein
MTPIDYFLLFTSLGVLAQFYFPSEGDLSDLDDLSK